MPSLSFVAFPGLSGLPGAFWAFLGFLGFPGLPWPTNKKEIQKQTKTEIRFIPEALSFFFSCIIVSVFWLKETLISNKTTPKTIMVPGNSWESLGIPGSPGT